MLALTKRIGYGLIAMAHLAGLREDELASARQIAQRFGVPISLLMNVLKELAAAGYVSSVRGARGGYRLARAPDEINLADLITTIEGPIRLAECVAGHDTDDLCDLLPNCPIADPVHQLNYRLRDFLREVTLADLMPQVDPAARQE